MSPTTVNEVEESQTENQARVPWRFASILALVAASLSIYLGLRPPVPQRLGSGFELDAVETLKMEQLRSQVGPQHPSFSRSIALGPDHTRVFLVMAATGSEPRLREASLEALLVFYSAPERHSAPIGPEMERVLLDKMGSAFPREAALAFRLAAMAPFEKASPEWTLALAQLFETRVDPSIRLALVEMISTLPCDASHDTRLSVLDAALAVSNAPSVLSAALFELTARSECYQEVAGSRRALWAARAISLASHADPGVRGRALGCAMRYTDGSAKEAVVQQLAGARKDPSGYVRAQALELTEPCGTPECARDILPLVSDLAPAKYEMSDIHRLDDPSGKMLHQVPGIEVVAEAALGLLERSSRKVELPGLARLELRVSEDHLDAAGLAAEGERAREWVNRWAKLGALPARQLGEGRLP